MDEYIYFWPKKDVYCYRSELSKFVEKYGHNYSIHLSGEFFTQVWGK